MKSSRKGIVFSFLMVALLSAVLLAPSMAFATAGTIPTRVVKMIKGGSWDGKFYPYLGVKIEYKYKNTWARISNVGKATFTVYGQHKSGGSWEKIASASYTPTNIAGISGSQGESYFCKGLTCKDSGGHWYKTIKMTCAYSGTSGGGDGFAKSISAAQYWSTGK